jgi:S-adenosyl-L-methionine hydrolase (adenosine-forming)
VSCSPSSTPASRPVDGPSRSRSPAERACSSAPTTACSPRRWRWPAAPNGVELTNPDYRLDAPGATFAGRDIFGPAAAHLCNGVELTDLGPEIDPVLLLPATVPLPRDDGDTIVAEVLWVDRFGNAQLNVGPDDLPAGWGEHIQLRSSLPPIPAGPPCARGAHRPLRRLSGGEVGLVLDSYGMLAVALDQRSAADELGLAAGDQVTLVSLDAPPVPETPVSFGRRTPGQ